MLRRCLATRDPAFGMVPPPRQQAGNGAPGNDYGTMLRIRNVQMLPDGRAIVETWGTWRFRIMERGVLDGYVVGRVERIDDFEGEVEDMYEREHARVPQGAGEKVEREGGGSSSQAAEGSRRRPPSNEELMAICRNFLEELKEGTPWVGQHLNTNYVPMPEDAARFSFWIAPVSTPLSRPLSALTDPPPSSSRSRNTKKQSSCRSAPRACACGSSCTGSSSCAPTGTSRSAACSPPPPRRPARPSPVLTPPKVPRLRLCLPRPGGSLVAVRSASARPPPARAAARPPRDGRPPGGRPRVGGAPCAAGRGGCCGACGGVGAGADVAWVAVGWTVFGV